MNLQGSATCCEVTLTWDAPYDGGFPIVDYIIEYSDDGNNWTEFNDGIGVATSTIVTGLTTDTEYYFRVFAVNSQGTSSASDIISETPSVPDVVSTGTSKIRPPPQIQGIGFYKFTTHVGDDDISKV